MKIAIPNHQDRVAPVCGTCRNIPIFTRDETAQVVVAEQDRTAVSRQGRALRLKERGIDVLHSGATSCRVEDQINREGIGLVAWSA
ncbi:MAG: hypothetical protein RDU20_03465 [Desulfomonilaceae bacterium]|nr:hypothetical protein [Desulfomonilaceae bacterium]